jgi:hypothetical protein
LFIDGIYPPLIIPFVAASSRIILSRITVVEPEELDTGITVLF